MISRKNGINDKGSAFVVVLICMLMIGIIAAIVLGLASRNLDNLGTGERASGNFYSTEEAVDELKDSLKELANGAIKQAYIDYLQTFALKAHTLGEEELQKEFRRLFAENLKSTLKDYFEVIQLDKDNNPVGTPLTPEGGTYKEYKELLYDYKDKVNEGAGTPKLIIDGDYNIILKGITLTYKDTDGFLSTIDTDLKFDVTVPTITVGSNVGVSTSVADFALIADYTISNDTGATGDPIVMGSIYGGGKTGERDTTDITGNIVKESIYNGSGLRFNGGNINLYSDLIISRESIELKNGANLNIKSIDMNRQVGIVNPDNYYSSVWAKNILINGSSKSSLDIQGQCFVADDLTIDSDGSSFKLTGTKSAYYGYSTNKISDTAGSSSSIVINGKAVKLDLSAANMLWLAGKSFVNVPSVWGDNTAASATFQQGESITYRSLQAAYLLPGECIQGVGHNPLSRNDLKIDPTAEGYVGKTYDEQVALKFNELIDINQCFLEGGMDLSKYIDFSNPYSYEFVRYGDESLVYVYMNFRSPDKAAEYFKDFESTYPGLVDSRMKMFNKSESTKGELKVNRTGATDDPLNKIGTLPTSHVVNTGNIVYYDGSDYILYLANTKYNDVKNKQIEYAGKFKNYYTTLTGVSALSIQDVTKNVVNMDHVTESNIVPITEDNIAEHPQVEFSVGDVRGYGESGMKRKGWMITSLGDVTIHSAATGRRIDVDGEDRGYSLSGIGAGIIIATGNVTIEAGADFWGTIIAQGNIVLQGDAKVFSASADVRKLMTTNSLVIPYFSKDSGVTKEGEGINTSNLVKLQYDNWKKD